MKKRQNKDVSTLRVWSYPNVRRALVCFKTAKLTLRFFSQKRSSVASRTDRWPSAPVQEATLDLLSLIWLWKSKKQHFVNGLFRNILDYCVFRTLGWHHTSCMEACHLFQTFFSVIIIIILNAGGSLDTILSVKYIPCAKLKNVCAD